MTPRKGAIGAGGSAACRSAPDRQSAQWIRQAADCFCGAGELPFARHTGATTLDQAGSA